MISTYIYCMWMVGDDGPDVDLISHLSDSPLLLLTRAASLFGNEIGRQGAVTPTGSLTRENETLIRMLGSKRTTGEGLGGRGNENGEG